MELDQEGKTIGRMCPGVPSRGGNTKQFLWSRTGWLSPFYRDSQIVNELFSGHKAGTWRVLHSRPIHRHSTPGLTLNSSAFSFCVGFGSRCLPFRASAGVASGHHRAACANSGVLGRRGFAVGSAVARVCREAGGRVSCNVFVRDVGVPIAKDGKRLGVVTDGLPLFHGAQLALDATMVSLLRSDGTPHRRAAEEGGAVLRAARRRKERTYPELTGRFGWARLAVLACEIGGGWSKETNNFFLQLAKAKARGVSQPLKTCAKQSWLRRWRSILACAAAKAFAQSLLEQKGRTGVDGPTPSISELMVDNRHCLFAAWAKMALVVRECVFFVNPL